MKPIDYRNEAWDRICARVVGLRSTVYTALLMHGPCTTRELSKRAGLDILTVRPRVTELIDIGFADLDEDASGRGHEGIYRALPVEDAEQLFQRRRAEAVGQRVQGELNLPV